MNVKELYEYLDRAVPASLSCDWDNDGLVCCPDETREVRKILVALDATMEIAGRAVREGYDVILTHHPMIFHPLRAVNNGDAVAKKTIFLLRAGVSVMCFHTRLDAVAGGVNDVLASLLGLSDVAPFGVESIGRIGNLPAPTTLRAFAGRFRELTGAPFAEISDAGLPVFRVAVLGGDGHEDLEAAKAAGADTYLTGNLHHDQLAEAPERGMNLIAGGHYYTENPVCRRLAQLAREAAPDAEITVAESYPAKIV